MVLCAASQLSVIVDASILIGLRVDHGDPCRRVSIDLVDSMLGSSLSPSACGRRLHSFVRSFRSCRFRFLCFLWLSRSFFFCYAVFVGRRAVFELSRFHRHGAGLHSLVQSSSCHGVLGVLLFGETAIDSSLLLVVIGMQPIHAFACIRISWSSKRSSLDNPFGYSFL